MRAVFGLVLVIGMGLAGFAVYMAKGYFQQQQLALDHERAQAAAIVPTVDVFALKRTINYGEQLTKDDVQIIRYVEAALPEGVYRTEEELFPEGDEELRVVTRRMEPLEPVLASKVSDPGEVVGITSHLTRGMRAFAIRVDATSGVSGFLRPGDRVDVYWSGQAQDQRGNDITQLIETSIRIIAVDQSADSGVTEASIARTVTVEASPHQVAALAQAQSSGRLSLALVGAQDDSIVNDAIAVNQASLLGVTEQAPEIVEEERVCTIVNRRGADIIEIPVPCTN
ncbi:Flp pilus assembly protein CpaB [Aestuariibius sp. HNIBRBA575]|uniref:Flp pilus assembly protein CpaB n=1 Tax=Aestuariibius sp. HNIBRBA575 TaxID=3233343 RepID=UPI0034A3A74C